MERTRSIKRSRRITLKRSLNRTRYIEDFGRPKVVYLTLGETAPSEMYVSYHLADYLNGLNIYYRKSGDSDWDSVSPSKVSFQNEPTNIYHSKLTGLIGDTEYEFKIGIHSDDVHRFVTMPSELSAPVNIAYGSDFHHGYKTFEKNLKIISESDSRVFVFGGDFVDDNGRLRYSDRWVEFWDNVAHKLRDSQGRLIPWLPIMGNHEVAPWNEMENLFFHDMFPHLSKGKNYEVVDVGNYISFYLLDLIAIGPYVNQENGKYKGVNLERQRDWFEQKLKERTNKPFNVPVYHPAFYSSDRPIFREEDRLPFKQLFKEYDIKIGLCGHDHVYKKTQKIQINGTAEQDVITTGDGFIEIGDGGMADKLYPGDRVGEWYIDTYAIHKPHVNIIKLESDKLTIEAKGIDGQVFDETVIGV